MILVKQGLDTNVKIQELEARIQVLEKKLNGRKSTQNNRRSGDTLSDRIHRELNDGRSEKIA